MKAIMFAYSSKLLRNLVQWFVLITVLVMTSACGAAQLASPYVPVTIADGQILCVSPGSTLYGIMQTISTAPGAKIFLDPSNKLVIFTWPVKEVGQAWVQMQNTGNGLSQIMSASGGKGNIANYNTWTQLLGYLKNFGWAEIQPSQVSSDLISKILLYSASAEAATSAAAVEAASIARGGFPTIIMMPVITFDDILRMLVPPQTLS